MLSNSLFSLREPLILSNPLLSIADYGCYYVASNSPFFLRESLILPSVRKKRKTKRGKLELTERSVKK